MSPLPHQWKFARLNQLGRWIGGGTPSKANPGFWVVKGIPWVSPKDMKALIPHKGVSSDYVLHALRAMEPRILQECSKSGTTVANLDTDRFLNFQIPLPPLQVQRCVVAKLENLFGRSKSAHEELTRIPCLVRRYKQAILAAAFRGDLTANWRIVNDISLDHDWSSTTLGDLCKDVRYGTAEKCFYQPKDTPVLRIPNVVKGRIDTNDLKYGRFNKKEIENLALRSGDLLVIRSNGSLDLVGRTALATDEVVGYLYAGYLIRLRLDSDRISPAFAQLAFEEPEIRQRIENFAKSTSGVNNINGQQLKALKLPIPPLQEQREIIRRVESAFTHVDHTSAKAERATRLLDRLDQATLAKAFRGGPKALFGECLSP